MITNRTQRPPAGETEPREQTIQRIAPGRAGEPDDPSTRRHLGRRAMWIGHGTALLAGVVTVAFMLALGAGLPFALALGGGVALAGGVLSALLIAEREDGRIERIVERHRWGGGR